MFLHISFKPQMFVSFSEFLEKVIRILPKILKRFQIVNTVCFNGLVTVRIINISCQSFHRAVNS